MTNRANAAQFISKPCPIRLRIINIALPISTPKPGDVKPKIRAKIPIIKKVVAINGFDRKSTSITLRLGSCFTISPSNSYQ
jgi:hypothetical protein